jgi:excisionase family DNA binding protein
MVIDLATIPRDKIAAMIAALAARLLEPEEPAPAVVPASGVPAKDTWLTAPEAAEFLRCSLKTLYRRAKRMSCCKHNGRSLLFNKAGLVRWLERQRS